MSGAYNIAWLCEALMVSRSGYYAWQQRRRHPGRRERENRALRAEPKGSWLEGVLPKRSNRDASLDESAMFSQPDSVW